MSLMGRVLPINSLNSLPETGQTSWAAIQRTFVQTGYRPVGDRRKAPNRTVTGVNGRSVPVDYLRRPK